MTTQTLITCTRCNGTGKHSYNLTQGDVCFKCGGAGQIVKTARGKSIKPTATVETAKPGDTIKMTGALYMVTRITWLRMPEATRANMCQPTYNQKLHITRVADGKKFSYCRDVFADGKRIETTAEMWGKDI